MATPLVLIYCPFPDADSARAAASAVLEARLAACCNLLPAGESHYWWEGSLARSVEHVLIAKTTATQAPALSARLQALHPYDCPAILTLPVDANSVFADWVVEQTNA